MSKECTTTKELEKDIKKFMVKICDLVIKEKVGKTVFVNSLTILLSDMIGEGMIDQKTVIQSIKENSKKGGEVI